MTWEELEEAGLCECGTPLDVHPELPKPGPFRGWTSGKTDREASEMSRRNSQESVFRDRFVA